uniref:TOG domain-containing protein n=1 Tax=Hanusia phi TaxID=3032 RepID=A0A7S0EVG8_9CRYP|mmetsp:Transcript_31503/g.70883  ORF Transcript_31503/g.70883 Transcript_31503/m.70883 type:complete len:839 (+) Transcript_31503:82-2598(+)
MSTADSFLFTQRDLNCLSDPDRSTRKRALEKILKEAQRLNVNTAGACEALAKDFLLLHAHLLRCLKDQAEKCRELAANILNVLFPLLKDAGEFVVPTFESVRERIGCFPQQEESEEVRLELLVLTNNLIKVSRDRLQVAIPEVALILEKSCTDKFPDAKKLTADTVALVCEQFWVPGMKEHVPAISKALQQNFSHQQQKVRVASLQAIGALLIHDCSILKDVLPHVAKFNVDRSKQLREEVLKTAALWLKTLDIAEAPAILPILLHGAADEIDQVQQLSVDLMEEVGNALEGKCEAKESMVEEDEFDEAVLSLYPKAFHGGRPGKGARLLTASHLKSILQQLLAELADWTAGARQKAAVTLVNVLIYAERSITKHAEAVLSAFSRSCMDEDETVAQAILNCIRLAGGFMPADVFIGVVEANLASSSLSVSSKKNWAAVLGTLLEGSREGQVGPLVSSISAAVSELELSLPDTAEYQVHVCRILEACINRCGSQCARVRQQLMKSLLRLHSLKSSESIASRALESLLILSRILGECEGQGEEDFLFRMETESIVNSFCEEAPQWRRDSYNLYIFDSLTRRAGASLAPCLPACIRIFAVGADPQKDADVRSVLLLLLDDLLKQDALLDALRSHGGELLTLVVLPVCVWRAGKVACALRKGGMSCLRVMLNRRICNGEQVMRELGEGFKPGLLDSIVKSCMDDEDAEIRFITCGALSELFVMVRNRLDLEQIRTMYIELLKRMDDSNDRIRVEAAKAFAEFLPSVPRGYDSTQFEYLLRGLVVHLDDANEEVQEGVLPAVLRAAEISPQSFLSIVRECRGKHRRTEWCDRAIAYAEELSSA